MPQVNCKQCTKEFYAKPFWIKRGYGIYCSTACQYEGRKAGEMIPCTICGKSTYKQQKIIKRSKTGKFFCGKSCQTIWRNSVFVGPKHANWKDGSTMYRSNFLKSKAPQVCVLCKIKDLRVLAVHHIDKNRKNNLSSNLSWLCHNCHFLVHHDKKELSRFEKKCANVISIGKIQ